MRNPIWKIIHIGHLQKNRFWEEEEILRDQICTTTLIQTDSRSILVDPGMNSPSDFRQILFQRSGFHPDSIDTVYLTHFHRHHWLNLSLFPKAVWLMSRTEIRWWQHREHTTEAERDILARIVPIEDYPIHGIDVLPTPGHTHGSSSLMFETREGMVIVAGDAVPTFDHFDSREPADHVEDAKEARRSIDRIAKIADLVVPGHDNFFVV